MHKRLLYIGCFCAGLLPLTSFATLNFSNALKPVQGIQNDYQTVSSSMGQVQDLSQKAQGLSKFSKKASPLLSKMTMIPRVYLTGLGGYDGFTGLGQADILLPILPRYDRAVFLYAHGKFGYNSDSNPWMHSTYTGSLGLGYRQVVGNSVVLGGYLLGDYTKTELGHSVMMVSPGFELLGKVWSFRWNGYLPLAGKTKEQETNWADYYGNDSYIINKGHKRYDAKFTYYEETGMGTDMEVGRNLGTWENTLFRGYLNGYYFSMKHNSSIYGGGARVTAEPTNYLEFTLSDSFDNQRKNVIAGGIRVDLYNLFFNRGSVDTNDLQAKLFQPIERNFGNIASGSSARETGGPDDPNAKVKIDAPVIPKPPAPKPNPYVENDNVWYVDGGLDTNTFGDKRRQGDLGTVEDPLSGNQFDQGTIDNIIEAYNKAHGYDHATIYVKGGYTYNNFNGHINLPANFMVDGVVGSKWVQAAQGNARPLFVGSFGLSNGDNINNISLMNNGSKNAGITINSGAVTLQNVNIGKGDGSKADFETGISDLKATQLSIKDSNIYANGDNAIGVDFAGSGDLTLNNTNVAARGAASIGIKAAQAKDVTISGDSKNPATISGADGVNVNNVSGNVNLDNIKINANYDNGTGILLGNVAGKIDIDNSTVNAAATGITGIAIDDSDLSSQPGDINISNDTIGISDSKINPSTGIKLANINNNNAINIANTDIYAGANDSDAIGIAMSKVNSLNVQNSDGKSHAITVSASGYGNAYGIKADGASYNSSHNCRGENITLNTVTLNVNADAQLGYSDSVNAYGIAIGDGDYDGSKNDTDISYNQVTINNSNLTIKASSGNRYDNDSGNAYGVLVGYGYAKSEKGNPVMGNIENNQVSINGGVLSVQAKAVTDSNAGNGYGVLVGYGKLESTGSEVLDIDGNTISIGDSSHSVLTKIDVSGESSGETDDNTYSDFANAYGMVTGYGALFFNGNNSSLAIYNNQTAINYTDLTTTGSASSSITSNLNDMGRAFGVLVGAGSAAFSNQTDSQNNIYIGTYKDANGDFQSGENSVTIKNTSNLTITGNSTHVATKSLTNADYGVLIGFGDRTQKLANILKISNNNVTLSDTYLLMQNKANNTGINSIYGVDIGDDGQYYTDGGYIYGSKGSKNAINVNGNVTIDAKAGDIKNVYGLYMFCGDSKFTVDTLENHIVTTGVNYLERDDHYGDGSGDYGYGLYNAGFIGDTLYWEKEQKNIGDK